MNVDRTKRGPSPRSSLTALAGCTFGAIPPPALVLHGIVSVQVGSALAKHLLGFQRRYEQTAVPFDWRFTRADLDDLLRRLDENHQLAEAA